MSSKTRCKCQPKTVRHEAANMAFSEPRPTIKISSMMTLLSPAEGATLAELTTATDCQVHSVRAVQTGVREKDHRIAKANRIGLTYYAGEASS